MTDPQKHFQELAAAVAAAIIAIGELWLATRTLEPSKPSKDSETPQPVVHETPAPATVPATDERGRISSRQLSLLRKVVSEKLDGNWSSFEATCKSRFGRATAYLTTREASQLISEMIGGGSNGNHSRTAAR